MSVLRQERPCRLLTLRDRHRVDFRSFCERVAKSTTFNRQEVEAVLNYATEIARDIVEFGDLGTLSLSFKSKVVPVGEVFNVQKHIEKPVVRLSPSRKYFTLTDVTYEQTTAKPKKGKTEPTPKLNGGGSSSGDDGL